MNYMLFPSMNYMLFPIVERPLVTIHGLHQSLYLFLIWNAVHIRITYEVLDLKQDRTYGIGGIPSCMFLVRIHAELVLKKVNAEPVVTLFLIVCSEYMMMVMLSDHLVRIYQ